MRIQLPPKRFEDVNDPKYDSIRHRPWFLRLELRRSRLPNLRCAAKAYHDNPKLRLSDAAIAFGVSLRDLNDYLSFTSDKPQPAVPPTFQAAVDSAYEDYCVFGAEMAFVYYLDCHAKLYGINPRHLTECWNVNRNCYPKGY